MAAWGQSSTGEGSSGKGGGKDLEKCLIDKLRCTARGEVGCVFVPYALERGRVSERGGGDGIEDGSW